MVEEPDVYSANNKREPKAFQEIMKRLLYLAKLDVEHDFEEKLENV